MHLGGTPQWIGSRLATHIEDARRVPNERPVVSVLRMFELRDCDEWWLAK
jgi:hypothetical protein